MFGTVTTSRSCISSNVPCSAANSAFLLNINCSLLSCALSPSSCMYLFLIASLPFFLPAILETIKSAPAPIIPPIVNSSNILSPIGSSSL